MSEAIGNVPIVHSIPETAKILKTNKNTVYSLVKMGLLKYIDLGDKKISDKEIWRFVDKYENENVDLNQMISDWKQDRKLEDKMSNTRVIDLRG